MLSLQSNDLALGTLLALDRDPRAARSPTGQAARGRGEKRAGRLESGPRKDRLPASKNRCDERSETDSTGEPHK
jgi:hypothetical protein